MKYKKIKRLIAIILVVLLLVNSISVLAMDESNTISNKIDDNLRIKLETVPEDERIPVWIWREPIDHAEISEMLMEEKGYNSDQYEDPNRFYNEVYPLIAEEVESTLGYHQAHKSIPILEGSEVLQYSTPIDSAVRNRMNDYVMSKRTIYKREYSSSNKAFLDNLLPNLPKGECVYCGKYSSTIIANLTKNEIDCILEDNSVEMVSFFQDLIAEPALGNALSQIGVYCEGGTGFDQINGWLAYNGYGVTIGIIEAINGRYDSTVPQLANNPKLHYVNNIRDNNTVVPSVVNTHATQVTITVAGKRVIQNGTVYPAGVVPAATVYQTSMSFFSELLTGIGVLVDNGCSIINCSLGWETNSSYHYYDMEIDRIINDKNILFVVAAGNKTTTNNPGNIKSPGKAINAITVGNVNTISSILPYHMYDGFLFNQIPNYLRSCYIEESYLPNKPDISAPGTALIFGTDEDTNTGTSFSAPIVAGVLAQMLQANSSLLGNPLVAKAKLLLSANRETIYNSESNNSQVGYGLYDKSGAGMVDSIASVNSAFSTNYYINNYSQDYTTQSFYCSEGQKLRAVLVFNRRCISEISAGTDLDDIDVYLRKSGSDNNYTLSCSSRNNVEIIEYTIPSSGYYTFFVKGYRIVNPSKTPQIAIAYKLS